MFDNNLKELSLPKSIFISVGLTRIIISACLIVGAITLGNTIEALWHGSDFTSLIRKFSIILVAFILMRLSYMVESIAVDRICNKATLSLQDEIVSLSFYVPFSKSHSKTAQELSSLALHKIDDINNYIRIIIPKMISMAVVSLSLFITIAILDIVSAIIILGITVAIIFFMIILGKQAKRHSERQYASFTRLTNRFIDTLRGMSTIAAHQSEESEEERTYRASEALRHATIKTLRIATLSSTVMDLLIMFAIAGAAIMLAFRLIDGSVSLSLSLSLLVLIPECFAPLRQFANDYHASLDGKNALHDVISWKKELEEYLEKHNPNRKDLIDNHQANIAQNRSPYLFFRSIKFDKVSYRIEGDTKNYIIDGFSCSFPFGSKIALIGKSGSGKTTLAHLFAGFIKPQSGTILIDNEPISLDDPQWKNYVRYIPQHPYLFRMSLRDNVAFYKPDATDKEIEEALDSVGLLSFAQSLEDGIYTSIGDGNQGMSGGQAHRVALARILLDANAHILIFDEPTAHLDIETEYAIKPYMLDIMKDKFVIFATHRLHWIEDMDYCINLETGKIETSKDAKGGDHE